MADLDRSAVPISIASARHRRQMDGSVQSDAASRRFSRRTSPPPMRRFLRTPPPVANALLSHSCRNVRGMHRVPPFRAAGRRRRRAAVRTVATAVLVACLVVPATAAYVAPSRRFCRTAVDTSSHGCHPRRAPSVGSNRRPRRFLAGGSHCAGRSDGGTVEHDRRNRRDIPRSVPIPVNVTLLQSLEDSDLLSLQHLLHVPKERGDAPTVPQPLTTTTSGSSSSSSLAKAPVLPYHLPPADLSFDGRFVRFDAVRRRSRGNAHRATPNDSSSGGGGDGDRNKESWTVSADDIFGKVLLQQQGETPLRYIRRTLTFGEDRLMGRYAINHNAVGNERETVILCGPGLDTTVQQGAEITQFASSVLEGLPLAYLHCATHSDLLFDRNGNAFVGRDENRPHTKCNAPSPYRKMDAERCVHEPAYEKLLRNAMRHPTLSSVFGSPHGDANVPSTMAETGQTQFVVRTRDLDRLRAVLAGRPKLYDTDFKRTVRKMIDTAVASLSVDENDARNDGADQDTPTRDRPADRQPRLVLLCYSAVTNQVAAAISEWIDETMDSMSRSASAAFDNRNRQSQNRRIRQRVEQSLYQSLTVVTLGSTCNTFPDGPAYIHVAMRDDPLSSRFGVTESGVDDLTIDQERESKIHSNNSGGGGRDAVYLHAYSPYHYARTVSIAGSNGCSQDDKDASSHTLPLDNDAHNIRACLIQWMAVVMRVNGTRSFRFLYDIISNGQLDIPLVLEDEVLPAMIRATKGYQFLWNPSQSLGLSLAETDNSCGPNNESNDGCERDECTVHSPTSMWDEDVIPSVDEARFVLEHQFGYDGYDEIVQLMEMQEQPSNREDTKTLTS